MKRKLYVNISRKDTIKQYLEELFSDTRLYSSCYLLSATYKNKKLTILDCKSGRRSLEDIINIVHTEYNELSEDIIKSFVIEGIKELYEEDKCETLFCPDINKLVFYRNNSKSSPTSKIKMFRTYYYDHNYETKGVGEYCLKDVLDLMGYKDNYEV